MKTDSDISRPSPSIRNQLEVAASLKGEQVSILFYSYAVPMFSFCIVHLTFFSLFLNLDSTSCSSILISFNVENLESLCFSGSCSGHSRWCWQGWMVCCKSNTFWSGGKRVSFSSKKLIFLVKIWILLPWNLYFFNNVKIAYLVCFHVYIYAAITIVFVLIVTNVNALLLLRWFDCQ